MSYNSSSSRRLYNEITNIYKLSQEDGGRESLLYDMDKDIDDSIVYENVSWKVLKRKCCVGLFKWNQTFLWNKTEQLVQLLKSY